MSDSDEDYSLEEMSNESGDVEMRETSNGASETTAESNAKEKSTDAEESSNSPIPGHSKDNQPGKGYPPRCALHMHHIMLHYIVMKIKAKKAYKEIQGIYGTKPMCKRHFYRLYEKYKPLYMEKKKRKDCVCCEIIPKRRPPSNPERILEFYRSHPGMPVREMAEKLGISTDIIYRRIRMADGVKREQKKRVQKKNKTKNPENTNGTNGTSNETTQTDVEGVE